jgi:hypothetical protein
LPQWRQFEAKLLLEGLLNTGALLSEPGAAPLMGL